MKIVVIGGSGLIGSKVVDRLRQLGHEVVAASPTSGVNTVTGEGLPAALAGAQVVVDVANSPSFEDQPVMEFFQKSGRHLLAAEATAGVRHHVALSVVGTERLQQSGYFRAKLVQENLIKSSGIPYTIVRATQFMEFLASIAAFSTTGNVVRVSPAGIQPIAADDVADALVDVTLRHPLNSILEIAGPELFSLSALIRRYLAKKEDPRHVIADSHAQYSGADLDELTLVPGKDARLGKINLETWYANQPVMAQPLT
ncbi:SDR family oxidoreductase [Hymenobacter volaticus]|uniref:SDR family oxidoreductase n=1 Tax=Hymenobacter volaticus TaxID=2932254 RepID=A0ABY4GEU4_9BACT|nr:SDR family oxidoreductase [Hymenobacter volaticus]UOQ69448.1 SDR family oxidoreductase [Hymenobacter volaticus]